MRLHAGDTVRVIHVYYKLVKSTPKVDPKFVAPIKAMIEESPSFGYRTVADLLGFNKNAVQRVFQLMSWKVRKRRIGFRPRIQALPSVRRCTDTGRLICAESGRAATAGHVDPGDGLP